MTDIEREVYQREIAERDKKIHELLGEIENLKIKTPTQAPPGSAMERATSVAHKWFQAVPGRIVSPPKAAGELWIAFAHAIEQAEREILNKTSKAIEEHWIGDSGRLETTRDCLELSDVQETILSLSSPQKEIAPGQKPQGESNL